MTLQSKRFTLLASMTLLIVAIAWFSTALLNQPTHYRSVSIEVTPVE